MDKMMAQEDIDSVFAEARVNRPKRVVVDPTVRADLYNFTRAGQITDEQMKAISSVNDFFAMNLKHTVGGWLRTQFHVKLVSGEQLPYAEFLDRLSEPTYLCSIRLEPLVRCRCWRWTWRSPRRSWTCCWAASAVWPPSAS